MLKAISDLFPTRQTQRYAYESFAMVLPHRPKEGLIDVIEDAPNFQAQFDESYVVSSQGLTATSVRNGLEVTMAFRILPRGLFVLDPIAQEERCVIPMPLVQGARLADHYGTTTIEAVRGEKLWVAERFTGNLSGYAKTCCAKGTWVLYQEVNTDRISYVVRQLAAPLEPEAKG